MKRILLAGLLACAPIAAHASDTFTFTTAAKMIDGVRVPATGAPPFQGVRVFTITTTTTYADGHKEATSGKCGEWRNPPGAEFPGSGVCQYDEYTVHYSCAPAPENGKEANCWGLLTGIGGRYNGKTGTITYRNGQTLVGTGLWN